MTNAGMVDPDYISQMKVVLAHIGEQQYRVEKGELIVTLIIIKIESRKLQDIAWFKDTASGNQGFGSCDATRIKRSTAPVPNHR